MYGGWGWIRTNVGASQRFYRPPPLASRAPIHIIQLFRLLCIATTALLFYSLKRVDVNRHHEYGDW